MTTNSHMPLLRVFVAAQRRHLSAQLEAHDLPVRVKEAPTFVSTLTELFVGLCLLHYVQDGGCQLQINETYEKQQPMQRSA